MNTYTTTQVNATNVVITRITEVIESEIPLRDKQETIGSGLITHIGGNKRFKFCYDNQDWITDFGNKIAFNSDKSEAICMDFITFPHNDLELAWKSYIMYEGKKPYWIEVPQIIPNNDESIHSEFDIILQS